jgi:hypothetical protein
MTKREDKLVKVHRARAADGREFDIQEIQEYLISEGDRIPGYKRFQYNGRGVNLLGNGDFELVTLGVTASPI